MLNLSSNILVPLFECWLKFREVVKVDSATCEHALRPSYMKVIGQCFLQHKLRSGFPADDCVHWRASRRIRGLSTLLVQRVSNSHPTDCTNVADVCADVETLVISPMSLFGSATNWLSQITPFCKHLRSVTAHSLILADFEWVRGLGNCVDLSFVSLDFLQQQYSMPQSLLHYYANCKHLEVIRLHNYSCTGIQSILATNTTLVELSLNSCEAMTEDAFTKILNLPLVQVIELGDNNTVHGKGVLHITTTSLHTLHLTSFDKINQGRMLRILEAIPNKQILHVKLVSMGLMRGLSYTDMLQLRGRFKSISVKL